MPDETNEIKIGSLNYEDEQEKDSGDHNKKLSFRFEGVDFGEVKVKIDKYGNVKKIEPSDDKWCDVDSSPTKTVKELIKQMQEQTTVCKDGPFNYSGLIAFSSNSPGCVQIWINGRLITKCS